MGGGGRDQPPRLPDLIFFRSNDSRCEWLVALGAVLDAAALLDATVEKAPAQARAGAHFVLRTGTRLVNDLAGQFSVTSPDGFVIAHAERFSEHRRRLVAVGYEASGDDAAAFHRFVERRKAYAGPLAALARRLHIKVDERDAEKDDSAPNP